MSIAPEAFGFVCDLVRRESAIVLESGKEYLVESRLMPLARATGDLDIDAYVARARRQPAGPHTRDIVEALTTNETSWFRDGEPFTAFRTAVLPDLMQARQASRRLRIWSAACSSGQEAYTVAMLLEDTPELAGWHCEVLGTDLSNEMVERSRAGVYSQLEVNRGLPATALVRHFQRDGAAWRVNQRLAAMTTFRQLNLVRPWPPMGQFDVVLLRNVLIYFDLPTKRQVLASVRRVLAPGGYLYLGASETTMGVDDAWERVPIGRSSVYRLRQDVRRDLP
jgi:chemotaxis protein methyltransferase CheR